MSGELSFFEKLAFINDPTSKYYVEDKNYEISPMPGYKNVLAKKLANGTIVPLFSRNMDIVKNMKLRSDDTFVIGQPKSGTTWTEEIAWLLNNNLDYERCKSQQHFERVPFIDTGYAEAFMDELKSPRTFKTHFLPKYLPENINTKSKVIYIVRNVKDLLVSGQAFMNTLTMVTQPMTLQEYAEGFLNCDYDIAYGAWWEHVDTYFNMPNILFLQYEDLVEDPIGNIKKMASFLNRSYTEEQINELAEFTSFKSMQKNERNYTQTLRDMQIFTNKTEFFRKGQIGNWRDHFSSELSDKIDQRVKEKLKSPIKFNYGV